MCAPRLANDTVMLTATVMLTIVSNMFNSFVLINFLCPHYIVIIDHCQGVSWIILKKTRKKTRGCFFIDAWGFYLQKRG